MEPSTPATCAAPTLVTGATGLLGNNVVRLLCARGENVRVLVRGDRQHPEIQGLDVEIVHGDVRDRDSVEQACRGVRSLVHCAAYVRVGWTDRPRYEAINVTGTRHVAEACRRQGIRLVHVSTTDVYGRCSLTKASDEETPFRSSPQVPYVVTKRAAEALVMSLVDEGLDAVVVNPAFMLGPWDWKPSSGKVLLAVARGGALISPRGWLSLCDARDVAEGILAARDRAAKGRRYILAGQSMQWIELLRLIAQTCQVRSPWARGGPLMLKIGGWAGDCWGWLRHEEPDVNSAAVAMAWVPKNYSSARAQQELGYMIRPSAESVRDAWQWFQAHGYR